MTQYDTVIIGAAGLAANRQLQDAGQTILTLIEPPPAGMIPLAYQHHIPITKEATQWTIWNFYNTCLISKAL